MKARLQSNRQSPRKVRLIADLIRGKNAERALVLLSFTPKRASLSIAKLLKSAIANARKGGASARDLYVKSITVDKGPTLKRVMPRARGRASRINKRTSHISLELGVKEKVK